MSEREWDDIKGTGVAEGVDGGLEGRAGGDDVIYYKIRTGWV